MKSLSILTGTCRAVDFGSDVAGRVLLQGRRDPVDGLLRQLVLHVVGVLGDLLPDFGQFLELVHDGRELRVDVGQRLTRHR